MSGTPKKEATLGDVARAAGISRVAASYALRNLPGVSEATRQSVRKIAERLNYRPDARIATQMASVRSAKARERLPIAWLNTGYSRNVWSRLKYLSPYLEGARKYCDEMGYRLDEFWLKEPGLNEARISQILFNRGIRGLIVAPPERFGHIHLQLRWEWFASVSFEKAIVSPGLTQIVQDRYFNIMLCLKNARRLGFRRIAILIEQQSDRRAYYACQAAAFYFLSTLPEADRLPLLYSGPKGIPKGFPAWLKRYRPDVIVGQNIQLVAALESAGLKVPKDIGVIHTAVDDDCLSWAGIVARKREIGMAAAEAVISLMQSHQYGLPAIPRDILIRGRWKEGDTLVRPPRAGSPARAAK